MSRAGRDDEKLADVDELVRKIVDDAHADDEQLWAFRQAFEDDVTLPSDGFVIGGPVSVTEINYDGNTRRRLTATCRREDGSEHVVAASDVAFAPGSAGARHVAALVTSKKTDKPLRLAAIDAMAGIRPREAVRMLVDLVDSRDEDIAAAAEEAMASAEGLSDEDDDDDDCPY